MLAVPHQFLWARNLSMPFEALTAYNPSSGAYGGSAIGVPATMSQGGAVDSRSYISFWGWTGAVGGCCAYTLADATANWGRAYVLDVAYTQGGRWLEHCVEL